jgi:predicted Zn-dependent peptidase
MQRIGRQWSYLGEHLSLEQELERINAVSLSDLQSVARAYPFSPRTRARLIPNG